MYFLLFHRDPIVRNITHLTGWKQHNKGQVESTKDRRPFELIYYEACLNRDWCNSSGNPWILKPSSPTKLYLTGSIWSIIVIVILPRRSREGSSWPIFGADQSDDVAYLLLLQIYQTFVKLSDLRFVQASLGTVVEFFIHFQIWTLNKIVGSRSFSGNECN